MANIRRDRKDMKHNEFFTNKEKIQLKTTETHNNFMHVLEAQTSKHLQA